MLTFTFVEARASLSLELTACQPSEFACHQNLEIHRNNHSLTNTGETNFTLRQLNFTLTTKSVAQRRWNQTDSSEVFYKHSNPLSDLCHLAVSSRRRKTSQLLNVHHTSGQLSGRAKRNHRPSSIDINSSGAARVLSYARPEVTTKKEENERENAYGTEGLSPGLSLVLYTRPCILMGYGAGILWLSCCWSRHLLERSFWSRERL